MRRVLYLFGQLNDDDIGWMMKAGDAETVPARAELVRRGETIDFLAVILDGEFAIETGPGGPKGLKSGSGEVIGEISFIDSRPPLASVVALQESLVWKIKRKVLTQKLDDDPSFACRFYRGIAVFLVDRLRANIGLLGYGEGIAAPSDGIEKDDLSEEILSNVHLAGARFERMLKHYR